MKKIYTCIDIASDTIRILVSEYYKGKLNTLAVSAVKSKGVEGGVITDSDLLLERLKIAISDINSRINVSIKKAIITIPSIGAEYNLVHGNVPIVNEDGMVTLSDISRVQNAVINDIAPNMELVDLTPIDFTIYDNGSEIETIRDPKNKICDRLAIRAMVTTIPKSNVISYVKVVEASGIEVVDLVLDSVANFEEIKEDEFDEDVMALVNLGKDTTSVSMFNKGVVTNSSVIDKGTGIINKDISYVYYISNKQARKALETFGIAHPKYANKNETYEVKDLNDKLVKINQFEFSEIINKRLTELLNVAKNEFKVLTNKQIRYIMVIGGITDIPGINFVVEDVFGSKAKVYSMNTLGIRKSRFITSSGAIKHFINKLRFLKKEYSMFSSDDTDNLVHNKARIGRSDSVFGRFFSYFFDN